MQLRNRRTSDVRHLSFTANPAFQIWLLVGLAIKGTFRVSARFIADGQHRASRPDETPYRDYQSRRKATSLPALSLAKSARQ